MSLHLWIDNLYKNHPDLYRLDQDIRGWLGPYQPQRPGLLPFNDSPYTGSPHTVFGSIAEMVTDYVRDLLAHK